MSRESSSKPEPEPLSRFKYEKVSKRVVVDIVRRLRFLLILLSCAFCDGDLNCRDLEFFAINGSYWHVICEADVGATVFVAIGSYLC